MGMEVSSTADYEPEVEEKGSRIVGQRRMIFSKL
jgi:hypothetical protein